MTNPLCPCATLEWTPEIGHQPDCTAKRLADKMVEVAEFIKQGLAECDNQIRILDKVVAEWPIKAAEFGRRLDEFIARQKPAPRG
jgi:hypothetical protein